jgi:hypothetical protein
MKMPVKITISTAIGFGVYYSIYFQIIKSKNIDIYKFI